jgi:hypothetical protein
MPFLVQVSNVVGVGPHRVKLRNVFGFIEHCAIQRSVKDYRYGTRITSEDHLQFKNYSYLHKLWRKVVELLVGDVHGQES